MEELRKYIIQTFRRNKSGLDLLVSLLYALVDSLYVLDIRTSTFYFLGELTELKIIVSWMIISFTT